MADLIRLDPSISSGWELYPRWEEMVKSFNARYLHEMSDQQQVGMTQTLRQRWINDFQSSGYWIVLRNGEPIAHVCGWLATDWNQPYAFLYQVEAMFESGLSAKWLGELDDWVADMNGILIARGNTPISFVEFSTFNDPKAMERLLSMYGRSNIRHRSVMRFGV